MPVLTTTRVGAFALSLGLLGGYAGFGGPGFAATAANHRPTSESTIKSPARFEFYKRQGLPAIYRGKTNPYQPTIALVLKGADRYGAHCASCHGPMGFGNGQASGNLHPHPADLAWSLSSPDTKDDFLFWTMSVGGAQFGTKMPAFKKSDLSDEEKWQIITYMRAAFEGREAHATTTGDTQQAAR